MDHKKILNDSIELLIIPLFFILTEYLKIVSLKVFLSIFVFYIYIGYKILYTIKNSLKLNFEDNKGTTFYLIQDLSFSYLIGIILNVFYGIFASSFLIYSNRLFYFIFFEIIIVINFICKKRFDIPSSKTSKSYSIYDFMILSLLLLPSLVQVMINFYNSPYPLIVGWDIFLYQGNTHQFLVDRLKYNFIDFSTRPPGFSFIQANIVISTNIPAYFLIYFDKIAVILINGFTSLWIYLICFKITKSDFASLIPSMLISTFDGKLALGPYYVLPSSFSWQIGIAIFYFLMYKRNMIENFKAKKKSNIIFYGYLFFLLLLIFICYFFHFFTCVVIFLVVLLDFIFEFINFKNKRAIFSIILFILLFFIIFQENILIINQIFNFISTQVNKILPANIEVWTFLMSITLLLGENYFIVSPILGIISNLIILFFKQREYDFYVFKFYLFITLIFIPIKAIYRLTYLIFIFSAILQSIALHELQKSNLKEKITKIFEKIEAKLKGNFLKFYLKIKKIRKWFNTRERYAILTFLILISPIFTAMNENFKSHAHHKIDIADSERIGYSSYTYDEYNAAVWLYENFDRRISNISADPGSNFFLYAISGITCLRFEVDNQEYRNFFLSCGEQGLNTSIFEKLKINEQQILILVITARFHKWIQTNSSQERGVVNSDWLNYTLLEYIGNTPGISKIYSNSEVFIYDFL